MAYTRLLFNLYVSTPAAGTEPRHREEKQRHVLQYIRNKQPVRRLLFALLCSSFLDNLLNC